ncbi:MAG: long-chain fatty acid--CoA ligase, partial [Anaerolineales bacterium]|nr:long-chain fatty acid--CoA ligase [Anaerolineales bacterium]
LVQSRTGWPESLRLILVGGAAATPELVKHANELAMGNDNEKPLVATTYGMTEASSQIATLLPKDTAVKPDSVGQPLLFTQVKITDEQGQPLPADEIGDIWVQGPTVTSGYVNNPTANAERFVGGWFRTGDMGYKDTAGDIWLVQRRSDLIVSGGENVYPAEVERVLRGHTAVADVCVVGLPDTEWGQKVAALVQVVPGKNITAEALVAFGRERLAGYKQPRLIRFTEALPLTGSGKVSRTAVRELLGK